MVKSAGVQLARLLRELFHIRLHHPENYRSWNQPFEKRVRTSGRAAPEEDLCAAYLEVLCYFLESVLVKPTCEAQFQMGFRGHVPPRVSDPRGNGRRRGGCD